MTDLYELVEYSGSSKLHCAALFTSAKEEEYPLSQIWATYDLAFGH